MLVGKHEANIAGNGLATAAWLVGATASQITTRGIGQFVVVKARERPDLAYIATVIHVLLGIVSMAAIYVYRDPIAHWIAADGMGKFVPGLILASMLDRICLVPERVLMRSMDFRVVSISRTVGDLL